MTFRIIPTQTLTGAQNMAYDESCMRAQQEGEVEPTIRLYRWKPSTVTIGYFQCLTDEVDVHTCRQNNIDIVRRQTGGGAVYHDQEITYSIIGPVELFEENITESYKQICQCVIDGLATLGIQAEFRGINDLVVDGKKISGNAQIRKNGILLQHGTILYAVEPEKMFTYLTPDKSKIADKPYIKSVKSAVTGILDHVQVTREEVETALRKAFVDTFEAKPKGWTEYEQDTMQQLVEEKYTSEDWNAMR